MDDQKLSTLLKTLPQARASAGFTRAVMARIQESSEPRRQPRRFLLPATVGALLVTTVVLSGVYWQRQAEKAEAMAVLARLRAEQRSLAAEVESLRRLTGRPVVFLGGTDAVDVAVDLSHLVRWQATQQPRAHPAVLTPTVANPELRPSTLRMP